MTSATEGLRDRKKRARQQDLHQATVALVLAHGFNEVTVDDICQRCEVSPRTFFNYFPSKEDALIGREPSAVEDVPAAAAAAFADGGPTGELVTDFRTLMIAVAEAKLSDHGEVLRRVEVVRKHPELLHVYVRRLHSSGRALRQLILRRFDNDMGPPTREQTHQAEVLADVGILAFRLALERGLRAATDIPATVGQVFDELTRLFTKGTS